MGKIRCLSNRQGFLRLLTFVVFFNFSGLNNGYSAHFVATAQPRQSLNLLTPVLDSAKTKIRTGGSLIGSLHHRITKGTLKVQSRLKSRIKFRSARITKGSAGMSVISHRSASPGWMKLDSSRYLNRQEIWKQEDSCKPAAHFLPAARCRHVRAAEKVLVSPVLPWIQAHRTLLKMACQRNTGGDSGDPAAHFSVDKMTEIIPGPALGIFIFRDPER